MNKLTLMFPGFKTKAFTMNFDDGIDTDIKMASIMKKYGIRGTFNLNPGLFSPEGTVKPAGRTSIPLTVSQAKELFSDPAFEIASHGDRHIAMAHVPGAAAMTEAVKSRMTLERTFSRLVRGFAYPFSSYDGDTKEILRLAGYAWARGNKDKDDFLLPREDEWYDWRGIHQMDGRLEGLVDKFVTEPNLYYHGWLLYVWAHTYEFEEFDTWDRIEGILKRIAACDDVWLATNSEIYDYVKAYRGLVWYADASAAYNPSRFDVFLRCDFGQFRIPAGGETKVIKE